MVKLNAVKAFKNIPRDYIFRVAFLFSEHDILEGEKLSLIHDLNFSG